MNASVYRKTDTNVPPVNEFSTNNTHPLSLFPEDRVTITDEFLRHLASCNLTPRRMRIALAVFNQTVGFQKLEDDMNGTRLQQLTGIAPNHANSTVRELARFNILVTRKGKYGNYMAINFAFDQWGSTDKELKPITNPCCLLPDEDDDKVIDNGIDLTMDAPLDDEPELTDTPEKVHGENVVNSPASNDKTTSIDAELIKQLLDAIKTLSDRIDQLEKNQQQATVVTTPAPQAEQKPEPQAEPQAKQKPEQPAAAEPAPKPTTHREKAPSAPHNSTPATRPTLRYPSLFTAPQCQQAASVIQHISDASKAQLLLDMLDKRLQQQHDPLRSPMRYLETLVKKFNNNQLSFNTFNTTPAQPPKTFISTTTSVTGAPTPVLSEEEKIKAEYQEAFLDHQQMERNLNMLAQKDNVSFEEAIQKNGIYTMVGTGKTTAVYGKEALLSLSGEQMVTV